MMTLELENKVRSKNCKLKVVLTLFLSSCCRQLETVQRDLLGAQLDNEKLSLRLQAESDHCAELEEQLRTAYTERVEMAKTCLEKDDQVCSVRREFQQSEEKNALLQEKNENLLQEIMEAKEKL